jgi:hypothetical protein
MQIYQTNAGLGYQKYAVLVRLDKSTKGYNYLCIDTFGFHPIDDDEYQYGLVVNDLEDYYVDECIDYDISRSPLYGTFLFDFFIKNYGKL